MIETSHIRSASSSKATTHHIHQRVSAIFMAVLLMWFLATVIVFIRKPISDIPWFLTSPITVIGSVLFILNSFYHANLGLKMIIEDYVHNRVIKMVTKILLQAVIITSVVAGLIAIMSIYILMRIN